MTAGTSVKSVIRADGTTVLQLDCARAVSVTQVTAGTARAFTVSGYDYYGQPMTEVITSVAGSAVNGKKAFYQIASVAVAGGTTTAASTTGDVRGTYVPSSATNGTSRIVMSIACNAIQVGPNATRTGALGVTQA